MKKMKKFDKIRYLKNLGLLRREFKDGKFSETKVYLYIRSFFIAITACTTPAKFFIALLFDQNDEAQMYVGNVFNHLDESPRFFFGMAVNILNDSILLFLILSIRINQGFIAISYFLSLFFTYNYLNEKKQNLLLLWLKMNNEIKGGNGKKINVIGLPVEENDKFWKNEDKFNYLYNRCYNVFLFISINLLNTQLITLNHSNFSTFTYIALIILHSLHHSFFWYFYFHCVNTLNIFFITTLIFIHKKFKFMTKTLQDFAYETSKIDNKKLNSFIRQWNFLNLETVSINGYFKSIVACNFINFSAIAIVGLFATLSADIKIQLVIFYLEFFT